MRNQGKLLIILLMLFSCISTYTSEKKGTFTAPLTILENYSRYCNLLPKSFLLSPEAFALKMLLVLVPELEDHVREIKVNLAKLEVPINEAQNTATILENLTKESNPSEPRILLRLHLEKLVTIYKDVPKLKSTVEGKSEEPLVPGWLSLNDILQRIDTFELLKYSLLREAVQQLETNRRLEEATLKQIASFTVSKEEKIECHLDVIQALLSQIEQRKLLGDADAIIFWQAVIKNNLPVILFYLEHGYNLLKVSSDNKSLMRYAVDHGNERFVKYLIGKQSALNNAFSALINKVASDTKTPLDRADELKHTSIKKLLIKHGAKYSTNVQRQKNSDFLTAIAHNPALVGPMLAEDIVEVDAVNSNEDSGLMIAVRNRRRDIIETLLRYGAQHDHKNKGGEDVFTCAKDTRDPDFEDWLKRQINDDPFSDAVVVEGSTF